MTLILDKDGKIAKGTDIDNIQNMLRHWLTLNAVRTYLDKLKLLPSEAACERLAKHEIDPGEAAKIFRRIILNRKARRLLVQIISLKLLDHERRSEIEVDLLHLAEEMKPLASASKSGLVIPS